MPSEAGDTADRAPLEAALREALAGLPDGLVAADEPLDVRWIEVGIRLGLEHPDRARGLLELLAGDAHETGPTSAADEPAGRPIPVASSLLARAAALPPAEWASLGPEVVYGWVARLTAADILHVGRVVGEMLAAGASHHVELGFGLAWTDGVRVPRPELEVMLQEFTELEISVGSVLAGRELRTGEAPPARQGLASWLGDWVPRARPGESQASAAIERNGTTGRRGLVALWNVWIAMRYRSLIPAPTFTLMVQPWVTVVGPLPDA
jgi:hypothetical protein